MSQLINIAYCSDANYLEHVSVSIKSIILNNLSTPLRFHVFLYNVAPEDINRLQQTSTLITIYNIEQSDIEKYQHEFSTKHISNSTFIRLLVPRLLFNKVDKLLYLDADILCFSDISEIQNINIDNYVCAAGIDSLSNKPNSNITRLNLTAPFYFNAGVLYINIANWVKNDIEKQANIILAENKTLKYADQDALNIVLQHQVLLIDSKWNYLFTWMTATQKETFFDNKHTLPYFIHFTGPRKMWYQEHDGIAQNIYCFYKHFTPWATSSLKCYKDKMRIVDYRVYSSHFLKNKQIIKSISYYLTYLWLKITKK